MPPKFRVSHLHYILTLRQDELLREKVGTPWVPVGRALDNLRSFVLESQLPAGKRYTSPHLVNQNQLTEEGRQLADEFTAVVCLIDGLRKIAHKFED